MRNNYQHVIPYLPFTFAIILSIFAFFKLLSYQLLTTNKLAQRLRPGFTIIEVIIVLAVAALILAVVLTAVAGLQRSQRTKAMQDAAGRLLSQEVNWEASQGGATPMTTVLNLALPATNAYISNAKIPANVPTASVTFQNTPANTVAAVNTMTYGGGPCTSGGGFTGGITSTSSFAVSYWSETAGAAVCINN